MKINKKHNELYNIVNNENKIIAEIWKDGLVKGFNFESKPGYCFDLENLELIITKLKQLKNGKRKTK